MKKYIMVNFSLDKSNLPEREKHLNILPSLATSQGSWVNLVVPSFYVTTIFGDKWKGDFIPICVSPLGSYQEGNMGEALWLGGFYWKIEVICGSAFKIMNSWIINIGYLWQFREQKKKNKVGNNYNTEHQY